MIQNLEDGIKKTNKNLQITEYRIQNIKKKLQIKMTTYRIKCKEYRIRNCIDALY